jgi:hypothetical protein
VEILSHSSLLFLGVGEIGAELELGSGTGTSFAIAGNDDPSSVIPKILKTVTIPNNSDFRLDFGYILNEKKVHFGSVFYLTLRLKNTAKIIRLQFF